MENTLLEAAKQIPALTVLIVLVWIFVKHIEAANAAMRETVMEIHKENMEARITQREVIRENTHAGKENTVAMTKLTGAVENLTRKDS